MNLITKDELKRLAQVNDPPAVSLYLPLEQEVDKHDQNRIRLKNLLAEAEKQLQQHYNLSPQEIADLLQPAARLIADGRFTTNLTLNHGLAVFLSTTGADIYTLPVPFTEQLKIAARFYLAPLLPLLMENGRFYILALSQNEIRFWRATAHTINEVWLSNDIPTSLADALKWEDPEAQIQWHSSTSSQVTGFGRRSAIFHGHGVTGGETRKDNIREYFRQIAAGIDDILKEQKAPLILAGVDYLLPIYQSVSRYPHLMERGITGNPEHVSPQDLREQAWEIAAPHFEQARQEAAALYANQAQTELATEDMEQVVTAAHYGFIDVLFMVDRESQYWGAFDEDQALIIRHDQEKPDSQDLLERAAVQTLLNGGVVYALSPAQMGGAQAAALLRAPLHTFSAA
jgi:hypothetical protein